MKSNVIIGGYMATESAVLAIIRKTGAPAITTLVFMAALIFIIGFCLRGVGFIKYGFGQASPESSLENRLDDIAANMATMAENMATKEDLNGVIAKVETIKVNDFGHLKNFLTELTSILLDKGIINNENKARLDNQLRDM
jgi:hypothetical protein